MACPDAPGNAPEVRERGDAAGVAGDATTAAIGGLLVGTVGGSDRAGCIGIGADIGEG
jgi:hypothetical protein